MQKGIVFRNVQWFKLAFKINNFLEHTYYKL